MATLCNLSVPAYEFGLAETLQDVSDVQVACESVAASSPTESLSLIRARASDRQQLDAAFTNDSTVAEGARLTGGEPSWLYRIEWATDVSLVRRMLTGAKAMVLSALGSGREWTLRVLYPSREACSQIHTVCEEHNLSVTIDAIREVDGEQSTRYGLTDAQYTALVQAYKMGYFAVPREVDLATVAETLGISHQALSERFRRAHQTLIETTLCQHGSAQATSTTETITADDGPELSGGQRLPTD